MQPNYRRNSFRICCEDRRSALSCFRRDAVDDVTRLDEQVENVARPFQSALFCWLRFPVCAFVLRKRIAVNLQRLVFADSRGVLAKLHKASFVDLLLKLQQSIVVASRVEPRLFVLVLLRRLKVLNFVPVLEIALKAGVKDDSLVEPLVLYAVYNVSAGQHDVFRQENSCPVLKEASGSHANNGPDVAVRSLFHPLGQHVIYFLRAHAFPNIVGAPVVDLRLKLDSTVHTCFKKITIIKERGKEL